MNYCLSILFLKAFSHPDNVLQDHHILQNIVDHQGSTYNQVFDENIKYSVECES